MGTSGGPRIDAHGRVQHVRDRPIPGLYGAGNAIASPSGPAYFGGGTTIGANFVLAAKDDFHTLMLSNSAPISIAPYLFDKPPTIR